MTGQVNEAVTNLYHAVNAMLLVVGRDGEIDSRHESTAAVMQALRVIDGGQYTPELQIQAHPSRGVVDEVAERRALNKALDALDALSERWASEIGLDAMCANLAKAADVPAAIRAMAVQAWVEGAYAGRTSHQAAALPAVPEGYVLVRRDSIERAAQMAEVFDDGSDGADAETAARVAHDLRGWLIAATPAHDQPEGEG